MHLDQNIAFACVTLVLCVAMLLAYGGRQVGRIESAVSRLLGIEAKLAKVDHHETRIGQLETTTATLWRKAMGGSGESAPPEPPGPKA